MYKGPKAKRSRSLGVALTLKAAAIMNKRPNPPGQHGAQRKKAKSNYGEQLLEKQRLKYQYNVQEKQLRNYYKIAKNHKGNTGEQLLKILESRLDSVVYRAGFAPTIYAARQLVAHGHILVNGKKVNIPSFKVSLEDIVSLSKKAQNMIVVKNSLSQIVPPAYLAYQGEQTGIQFAREPMAHEIPVVCRIQMVIEFYAR
jgi:small subunit ribosomal protein S4